jgi:hypothetical protein
MGLYGETTMKKVLLTLFALFSLSSCTIPFSGKEYGIFAETWKEERDIVGQWGVDSPRHKEWKSRNVNDWTRGKWDPKDPYGLKQK